MADISLPQHLNFSSNPNCTPEPPRASCGSPLIFLGLLATPVALAFWLWRNLHLPPLPDGAPDPDQIPAIPEDADEAEVAAAAAHPAGTRPRAEQYRAGEGASSSGRHEATPAAAAHFRRYLSIRFQDATGADSIDMIQGCPCDAAASVEVERQGFVHATATFDRSGEAEGILNTMVDGLVGTLLVINDVDESTIHPANGLLVGALESANAILCCTAESSSQMLYCWACKVEGDAQRIWKGEKGREYIFLLSNVYDVCGRGANFSKEAQDRLEAVFHRYLTSYLHECWAPLMNYLHLLDKFIAEFNIIYECQGTWKVTANLRYKLREEIADFIVPKYQDSVLAPRRKNQSRLSGLLPCLNRVMSGKKKQKFTAEKLKEVIHNLFEG